MLLIMTIAGFGKTVVDDMVSSASRILIIPEYQECLQIPASTSIHDKTFSVHTAMEMVLHSIKKSGLSPG
jgi:hypothetical protein